MEARVTLTYSLDTLNQTTSPSKVTFPLGTYMPSILELERDASMDLLL